MFFSFVDELRAAGIPASMKEHLTLLEALDADVIGARPEEFYYLARATFVKDEGLLDRFDQVFAKVFKGIETSYGTEQVELPEEWLKAVAEKYLTPRATTDPWGTPLAISCSEDDWNARSAGSDRCFGTADDITSTASEARR